MVRKNAWLKLDEAETKNVFDYNDDYKKFLDIARTERLANQEIIKGAKENGFKDLEEVIKSEGKLEKGGKYFVNHKNKSVALIVYGSKPLSEGLQIVGAHIDSPRLDLKPNPLYENSGLVKLKTHYYGGVKKYQYTTIPLAIHGVVYNKDGKKIEIAIGDDINDPVFTVTDLLIHLSRDQQSKPMREAITGEQLNVLFGSIPLKDKEKDAVKENILKLIKEKYNFEEEDFQIAELEVVPACKSRDLGLDRSMVIAYGQDDRVCAYATMRAIFDVENPEKTALGLFMDKEEIGSMGNTGMASYFWENLVHELVNLEGNYSALDVNRTLKNSKVLSADVTVGYDPDFADAVEAQNTASLGCGIVVSKYSGSGGKGGSSDANAEFLQEVRKCFDDKDVTWQTGELGAVDKGGGGTIALLLAKYGAEVVDCGPAVLCMHAPMEVTSKADTYMCYKAYKAFMA